MKTFIQQYPWLFCLGSGLSFSATMYIGSVFSLGFDAKTLIALSLSGWVLGWLIGLELVMRYSQRSLKMIQCLTGIIGGGAIACCIQISIHAALIGACIGLLLALTIKKRLFT